MSLCFTLSRAYLLSINTTFNFFSFQVTWIQTPLWAIKTNNLPACYLDWEGSSGGLQTESQAATVTSWLILNLQPYPHAVICKATAGPGCIWHPWHLLGDEQTLNGWFLKWGLVMNVLVHMSMCTHILYIKTTVMTGLRACSVPREMQEIFWLTCAATSVCLAADLKSLCCIVYSTALQKCIVLTGCKAESNWSGKFWVK